MRFKYLTLHGFKTFANKTEFIFDLGVTAVVGPNGSGKSNVADAVRWVMGENTFSQLRVKRTEDLVFSGSSTRARLGMAEVFMTLENPNPLVEEKAPESTDAERIEKKPEEEKNDAEKKEEKVEEKPAGKQSEKARMRVDIVNEIMSLNPTEVTIGRRAYRDGENEYFINNQRVRRGDMLELLARWGLARQTYAVIGQGLVDQALSLRPEERRALFEEAAGIGLYQSKRSSAIDKLEETQRNLLRVNDIINEISPRLPSLARQAERARNYDGVVGTLDEKLRTWYAFQWTRANQVAHDAIQKEKVTHEALNSRRSQVQDLSAKLSRWRRQGQELRQQLNEGRRLRAQAESTYASRLRELAVFEERLRSNVARLEEAQAEVASLKESRKQQEERIAQATAVLDTKTQERDALTASMQAKEAELREQERIAANAEAAMEKSRPQLQQLARKLAKLRAELGVYEHGLQLASSLSLQAEALTSVEQQRSEAKHAVEATRGQIGELRTAIAIAERDVAGARADVQSANTALAQWDAQIAAREKRVETVMREVETVKQQGKSLQTRVDESAQALEAIDDELIPAEQRLVDSEKAQSELEEQESQVRARLVEFEESHNEAVLNAERARSEIKRLQTEIEDDLASGRIVASKPSETEAENGVREVTLLLDTDLTGQLRMQMGEEMVSLPVVTAVPEGLEKEIRRLRNQLKYMGTINPNAPQEYDELKARHTFLTDQTNDARLAIESLNKAIAELDEIMRVKFEETFKAVNVEFAKFFTMLFNGGTARLELTDPQNITATGIDITAKPPGKRAAHLAILSGGERAMTAAALLFAILRVSPTPFCVLDEVDAALDEANVGRFRDALRMLAAETQFIVVTHNRTTMESANTIYGITMSDDGVSQAMSMRLEEAKATAR